MTILEIERTASTPGTKPVWSERLDELKGYLADRLSYGVIAEKFGVSRGAVSGAVDRYNLRAECPTRRAPSISKRPRTSAGRQRKSPTTEAPIEFTPRPIGDEPTDIVVEFIPPNPVRFIDSTDQTCKFPLDQPTAVMMVCGDPVRDQSGCPYCSIHAARAYVSSAPRKPWVPGRAEG